MSLSSVLEGREYIIKSVETNDEEFNSFLFSLGCYSGEPITVIFRRKKNLIISVKDGRYSIDNLLAEAITVEE